MISKPNVERKKVLKLNVKVNKETIQNKTKSEINITSQTHFKIDRNTHSFSSSSAYSLQTLPEYTAYLNSDTDILDSSSSNPSPSAPYSPDRATATPTNTPILQTQTSVVTTQPQAIPKNLLLLYTGSPTSDSCDDSNTT